MTPQVRKKIWKVMLESQPNISYPVSLFSSVFGGMHMKQDVEIMNVTVEKDCSVQMN